MFPSCSFLTRGLVARIGPVAVGALALVTACAPAEPTVRATDEEPDRLELYRFGVETMEENQIRVLTTSDMGRVAETARHELRI